MALLARVPPGRAGRMWLRRRLATAELGREQLDRKLRILLPDLQRLRIQQDRTREQWVAACEAGTTWLLRTVLLGGEDVLRHAVPAGPARVEVAWTTVMGLRYPSDAELLPSPEPHGAGPGNAAIAPATAAYRAALEAGVRAAAAEAAVRRLETEIAVTRRRLRALENRWLPRLRAALVELELALADAEQEDGVRLRRARPTDRSRRDAP